MASTPKYVVQRYGRAYQLRIHTMGLQGPKEPLAAGEAGRTDLRCRSFPDGTVREHQDALLRLARAYKQRLRKVALEEG